jgi:hypothetical protein
VKRILFDHCTPKPLRRLLSNQEIRTCYEEGWATLRNGDLLAAADAARFDIFITADRNLRYQQNLGPRQVEIIEFPTNRLALMERLVPAIQQALTNATPGTYQIVSMP